MTPAIPILGIRCWPEQLGDGSVYVRTRGERQSGSGQRGIFFGASGFDVAANGREVILVARRALNDEETITATVQDTREVWTPTAGMTWAPYINPDPDTLPAAVDCYVFYEIEAEPDPLLYRALYGVGHTYHLVVEVNGVTIVDADVLAGATATVDFSMTMARGTTYTGHAYFYSDSTLSTLLNTVTYSFTTSP